MDRASNRELDNLTVVPELNGRKLELKAVALQRVHDKLTVSPELLGSITEPGVSGLHREEHERSIRLEVRRGKGQHGPHV
mmetsp:Transcript_24397/g.69960  ORF Transcript_24397/g.69960 Transcript_24397/m.69960 type:complete len:80 (-) Transcript_24397:770-1009(-)